MGAQNLARSPRQTTFNTPKNEIVCCSIKCATKPKRDHEHPEEKGGQAGADGDLKPCLSRVLLLGHDTQSSRRMSPKACVGC